MESSAFTDAPWADTKPQPYRLAAMRPRSLIWSFAVGNWQRTVDGRNLPRRPWRASGWSSHRRTDSDGGHRSGRPESESRETRRTGRSPDCLWRGSADATFPISLVPVAKAPRPYPCRDNALCTPTAPAPPRQPPFLFLGSTSGARARAQAVQPPGSDSHLRLTVPKIEPGVYAFVIFAVSRQGPPGALIADTGPGDLLRVLPTETAVGSSGDGSDATLWIVPGIGTIALVLAAVLLLRRRRAS